MSRGPQPQRTAKALPVVFVVDDDPSVREALSSLFRSVDLQVELFGSTAERTVRAAWCSTSACRA